MAASLCGGRVWDRLACMFVFGEYNVLSVLVWLAGLLLAILRWNRHSRVSAAVFVSMVCLLVVSASQFVLVRPSREFAQSLIGALLNVSFSTVGLAMLLVAIFGWRETSGVKQTRQFTQFSVRNLLILTSLAAVTVSIGRWLALKSGLHIVFVLAADVPFALFWLVGGSLAWKSFPHARHVSRLVAIAMSIQVMAFGLFVAMYLNNIDSLFSYLGLTLAVVITIGLMPLSWSLLLAAVFSERD
jgi:hypothetical protein